MFIVNPFTKDPQDRIYRTGELGRYLPDGNVEWAGRNDRRVNIRGFRVELEEIEAILKRHPASQRRRGVTAKLSRFRASEIQNPKSKTKIDSPLSPTSPLNEESQSLADLLQSYLTTRLPDYMVPAYFVVLQSLPLSPNGKVDYRSLPSVQFSASVAPSRRATRLKTSSAKFLPSCSGAPTSASKRISSASAAILC